MELIKIALGDYPRYEELLLRKDKLEKEAFEWYDEYVRVFGKFIISLFEVKVECVRLKKMIALAQVQINRGYTPDMDAIDDRVKKQMRDYYSDLRKMIDEHKETMNARYVSEYDVLKIKKIYRNIAKMLHPDINPVTSEDPALLDLWNRVVIAYKCNKLKDIEELQVLVNKMLNEKGIDASNVVIPDIEEKIKALEKEIDEIVTTDPYNFKFLLEDKEAIAERIKELEEQKEEFDNYKIDLENTLSRLIGET